MPIAGKALNALAAATDRLTRCLGLICTCFWPFALHIVTTAAASMMCRTCAISWTSSRGSTHALQQRSYDTKELENHYTTLMTCKPLMVRSGGRVQLGWRLQVTSIENTYTSVRRFLVRVRDRQAKLIGNSKVVKAVASQSCSLGLNIWLPCTRNFRAWRILSMLTTCTQHVAHSTAIRSHLQLVQQLPCMCQGWCGTTIAFRYRRLQTCECLCLDGR